MLIHCPNKKHGKNPPVMIQESQNYWYDNEGKPVKLDTYFQCPECKGLLMITQNISSFGFIDKQKLNGN